MTDKGLEIRPEVLAFARAMEEKLRKNEYKGGWENCSPEYLFCRAEEEMGELCEVISDNKPDPKLVLSEAVDVANFLMMLVGNLGSFSVED